MFSLILVFNFVMGGQIVFAQSDLTEDTPAQTSDSQYFPETGHNVSGEFWAFYSANPNARLVYGLPSTEAYIDANTGILIQYFQNVRFELHPTNPPGSRVVLTPIGSLLYEQGKIIEGLSANTPNCTQENGWKYPVCSAFYDFYVEQNGAAVFGLPVSGLEYQQGRLVQYFEKARLVWMPENPTNAKITITPLGLQYFYFLEENENRLDPIRNLIYSMQISEIRVRAFSQNAVLKNGDSQTIYVIAKDQNNTPLAGGFVDISIQYPDGTMVNITHVATNEKGLAQIPFNVNSAGEPGITTVVVTVRYNSLETSTVTSFRIWY